MPGIGGLYMNLSLLTRNLANQLDIIVVLKIAGQPGIEHTYMFSSVLFVFWGAEQHQYVVLYVCYILQRDRGLNFHF